ncbi:hypothetical protein G6F57_004157 [Rhizopus arrhizus]|uniref:RlpA-like protein double-psi beta-barrel domain-containing protein n=1 Tax=Rhizopus oryzae TaxID=64495 RepID=A0A9P6X3F6_RHIOR|nr:hypothetical protein G6F23_007266 [Rhizopus arrhizus]KAG1413866.1 hypothetical protein G6F58_007256 [Rhizopus delemar]KAG0759785.1 hypothetical protein G6F24_008815 [Rhizopus arrhizus]KAG0793002.1 hypothetical protein G6F21_003935 [Rhizopus arrhizus]KAG0799071.1 hypothetical protein G6F22_003596 [Rhizopus arrhizus]
MSNLNFLVLLALFSFCILQKLEALVIKRQDELHFSGKGSYYNVGPGTCGDFADDSPMVVAVNTVQLNNGASPYLITHCNGTVKVVGTTGKEVVARIVDSCSMCQVGSLDLSPTVFQQVCGSLGQGSCDIKWGFI